MSKSRSNALTGELIVEMRQLSAQIGKLSDALLSVHINPDMDERLASVRSNLENVKDKLTQVAQSAAQDEKNG